jgi:2-aminobenzoate-CoA ligase
MVASPSRSAHVETFVRDHLPPMRDWPLFDLSGVPDYPLRLNCAAELLDRHVAEGRGDRIVLHFEHRQVTYAELRAWANRIATYLVQDLGVRPGARVLLRGFNSPWMVAAWFAIVKAGGVVVATMPMLRARELAHILDKAAVDVALCDGRLADEMRLAQQRAARAVRSEFELDAATTGRSGEFENVDTSADDPVLIAFTSGTTGQPKGAVHCHRDVLAICDTYGRHVLRAQPADVFVGTPPLAIT